MKKKILVDLYKINEAHTGLAQFSFNFAKSLIEHIPDEYQVDFLVPRGKKLDLDTNKKNIRLITLNIFYRFPLFINKDYVFHLWHKV